MYDIQHKKISRIAENFVKAITIIDVGSIERTSQCATISNIATSQMIDHIVHSYSVDFYVHIILINTHIKGRNKKKYSLDFGS
jgi:hypothetical protein